MAARVLVTIDRCHADETQVRALNAELQRRGWTLYPGRHATYCAEVRGTNSDQQMVAAVEQDITEAAEAARIYDWSAICVLSFPFPSVSD
jgi:hypothetical protein